jgi:pseudaminic acid cytidylyltransferase
LNRIAIIPARGGSKRIPLKNIKNFLGKPIISFSIQAAIESKLFDEVMVSTEDEQIAKISLKLGAKVPFLRSLKSSDDFATTFDVIEEVVQEYTKLNQEIKEICCIYACAPFVSKEKLISSYELMKSGGFDSVFPIMPYGYPIQRALKLNSGKVNFINTENSFVRSQDLETNFHDTGQFYWMNSKVLLEKNLITTNSGGFIISELEGQDIDNDVDWKLAELKYELLQSFR